MDHTVLNIPIADFDPAHAVLCGQFFRYRERDDGFLIVSGGESAFIPKAAKKGYFEVAVTNTEYFSRFFDLDTDYSLIKRRLSEEFGMAREVDFGRGIRIFRQPPFETLIQFIISANNNIPRIRGAVERICEGLGEPTEFYGEKFFSFPTAETLSRADADFFRRAGVGYRAEYIVRTARRIVDEGGETALCQREGESDAALKARLLGFCGVGEKVADCVLLFAYGKTSAYPVDTWIKKSYNSKNKNAENTREKGGKSGADKARAISKALSERFGALSGYAQQYAFFFERSGGGSSV